MMLFSSPKYIKTPAPSGTGAHCATPIVCGTPSRSRPITRGMASYPTGFRPRYALRGPFAADRRSRAFTARGSLQAASPVTIPRHRFTLSVYNKFPRFARGESDIFIKRRKRVFLCFSAGHRAAFFKERYDGQMLRAGRLALAALNAVRRLSPVLRDDVELARDAELRTALFPVRHGE